MIVCTHYRAEMLKRCLGSLAALKHPSYEVLVVDNTPGDATTERVASQEGARYIPEPRAGLSRARNAGARAASGELIGFIDDDAIAEPSWLQEHSAALSDPDLAATTGRITPISFQRGGDSSGPATQSLDLGDVPFRVDDATPDWFEMANFGGLGFGGNMVLKRSLFDAGFSFRESLGAGATLGWGEEFYAFFTIIKAGHGIAYIPGALVRHDGPVTRAGSEARALAKARRRSAAYLFMLMTEEPKFRRRTRRYIVDGARRRPPPWRRAAQARQASRLEMLTAAFGGPLLYLRGRLSSR